MGQNCIIEKSENAFLEDIFTLQFWHMFAFLRGSFVLQLYSVLAFLLLNVFTNMVTGEWSRTQSKTVAKYGPLQGGGLNLDPQDPKPMLTDMPCHLLHAQKL